VQLVSLGGMAPPPMQVVMDPSFQKGTKPSYFGTVTSPDGFSSAKLLHHSAAHPTGAPCMHTFRGVLYSFTGACWGSTNKELTSRRFAQVWEHQVVINEPASISIDCCCNTATYDRITVIQLDDEVLFGAAKAGPCSPFCINCDPCPDCFESIGETLILFRPRAGCCEGGCDCYPCVCCKTSNISGTQNITNGIAPWSNGGLCSPWDKTVYGLENVQGFIQALQAARAMRGINQTWHKYPLFHD